MMGNKYIIRNFQNNMLKSTLKIGRDNLRILILFFSTNCSGYDLRKRRKNKRGPDKKWKQFSDTGRVNLVKLGSSVKVPSPVPGA